MFDWRLEFPELRRRIMRRWLWSIAVFTWCVLIVGGATRLTHSGLSMVQWQPILGVMPPITHTQWEERFDQYKQFPEYQKLRQGMTLHEFKFIFYWEYLHRLLARSIGIVFLLPFAFFLIRKWMNRELALRAAALFGLGAMQGVMGWLMVASGLVDRPSVSHYRLAAHLSLAFMIFGYAVWLARELSFDGRDINISETALRRMKRGLAVVGVLLCAQIIWGAFVAGLKAGFLANTFPLTYGRLVPDALLHLQPVLKNFVANPIAVQWTHRVLGTALALTVAATAFQSLRTDVDAKSRRLALCLVVAVLAQYLLGVITLIKVVPVPLGVAHQAMAMLVFGVWVVWLHHSRHLSTR